MLVYGDRDELLACGMFLRARVRGIPVPFGAFERGPVFRDASVVEGVLGALKKAFPRRFLVRVRMHPYALEAIQTVLHYKGGCICVSSPFFWLDVMF